MTSLADICLPVSQGLRTMHNMAACMASDLYISGTILLQVVI